MENEIDNTKPLQLLSIQGANVKAMKLFNIKFDGPGVLVITGANGQGKTSLSDAFYLAIGGRLASKDVKKVIRKGEEYAVSVLDLGRLIVTREWKYDKNGKEESKLYVKQPGGEPIDSPQTVINSLFELTALDAGAFSRMSDKEQVAELIRAVGETERLEKLDEERDGYFTARTDKTRDAKAKLSAAKEIPLYEDGDVPDTEYSTEEIVKFVNEGLQAVTDYDALVEKPNGLLKETNDLRSEIETAKETIAKRREALADAEGALQLKSDALDKRKAELVDAQEKAAVAVKPTDIEELKENGKQLDELNGKVRKKLERRKLLVESNALDKEAAALTSKITDVDEQKAKIIADAELPVPGLSFSEDGITLNGIPLSDSSKSDNLKVGVVIAMALNPTFKLIRIENGSDLDAANMQWLREIADKEGFLIIVERVEDDSEGVIVIEDGEVVGAVAE